MPCRARVHRRVEIIAQGGGKRRLQSRRNAHEFERRRVVAACRRRRGARQPARFGDESGEAVLSEPRRISRRIFPANRL